jgi:AcrR family transcriptional regulator
VSNREKLLAGAKQLIAEKGYGQITARELVTVSETNLASIGYHFGSKEALLTEAVLDSFTSWGADLKRAIGEIDTDDPAERLAAILDTLVGFFSTDQSSTIASIEAFARSPHAPEVRERLAAVYADSRAAVASVVLEVDPADVDAQQAHRIGSLGLALIDGLALQWLVDPKHAPSGSDIAEALRDLGARQR